MKNTTAQTIANQIGNKALYMIGAKNLMASNDSLTFKVMRNEKGVTHVRITLTPMDVYTMEFLNIRGMNVKTKSEVNNVYYDQLNKSIENNTNLYTSL